MSIVGDVLLPASLWFIMFSMGLSLTLQDFGRVFMNRKALVVGALSMLVALPILGAFIAWAFAPTQVLAVGFILLATCPGGMLSNLMTDIAKGDLALSLSMSILVSFVYVFIIPFYTLAATSWFLGIENIIEVPLSGFFGKIFSITLLPVSLGVLVRRYRAELATGLKPWVKWIATTVLVVAFIAILVDQVETLKAAFGPLLFMVALMNVVAIGMAWGFCSFAKVTSKERIAICIEHLIRQEGTAIYIAVSILGSSEMSLPMIINTPVALVICIAFVTFMRWRGAGGDDEAAAAPARVPVER